MRDLHTYVAPERAPTHVTYRGNDIYSMGPPSSGGSTVGEALNILEGYDLSAMPVPDPLCTTSWRHRGTRSPIATRVPRRSERTTTCRSPVSCRSSTRGHLRVDHGHGGDVTRGARRSAPVQRGQRVADGTPVRDDHPPDDERQVGQRRLDTFTIESTGGSGLVVPGFGSCSTTSSPTSTSTRRRTRTASRVGSAREAR